MRALHRLFGATCFVLVFTPWPAGAQQDQIPKELALALIRFGASEGGEIIVGKLPPDLAGSFTLPSGARVLGSYVTVGYGQAVIALPGGVDSAQAFVRKNLLEHGWVPRSPMGPRMGGLQYGPRGGVPTTFCKAGEPDGLSIAAQFYGRETLVRLTRTGQMTACSEALGGRITAERTEGVVFTSTGGVGSFNVPFASLPPLWSPGDPITSMRACHPPTGSSGALSAQSQQQSLRSELSPEEILAYYGKQLDSAGWRSLSSQRETVTRSWAKTNAARDTTQEVTLIVTRLPMAGCYDIQLRADVRGPTR